MPGARRRSSGARRTLWWRGTRSSTPGRCPRTTATATTRSRRTTRSAGSCRVTATPTLVFADGSVVPGALPAQRARGRNRARRSRGRPPRRRQEIRPARGLVSLPRHPTERERTHAMAIIDFLKKQFIDIIEWTDDSRDTLSFRFPDEDKEIKSGAHSSCASRRWRSSSTWASSATPSVRASTR